MEKLLIDKIQNYTLNRKVLSIDSNDRDFNKWPNANEFEINCPQDYTNIESLRLLNIQFSNIFYNISEELQNNKFIIKFSDNVNNIISLEEGIYTPIKLQNYIQNKINDLLPGSNFIVKYNELNNKMYFGYTDLFSLDFISYDLSYNYNCKLYNHANLDKKIYTQYSNWGLGSILGFDKSIYTSIENDNNNNIYWNSNTTEQWIQDNGNDIYSIYSPNIVNLNVNEFIYLEIDKFNTTDAFKPFTDTFTNLNINNNSIINSYFAKFPIIKSGYNQSLNVKDNFLDNISYYQPPIEKISKLKFRFRYHNGIPVNFYNSNIVFTLEINQIRNEIKDYNVRIPFKL